MSGLESIDTRVIMERSNGYDKNLDSNWKKKHFPILLNPHPARTGTTIHFLSGKTVNFEPRQVSDRKDKRGIHHGNEKLRDEETKCCVRADL